MTWVAIGAAAVSTVGGAMLGGKGSSQSSTQQAELDPRMQGLLYGDSGKNGLLNEVYGQYQKQSQNGGLNPLMTSGLEMQRQTLTDPSYTQGYASMRNLGLGLMGGGVAGNPFTGSGGIPRTAPGAAAPQPQFNYTPNAALAGAASPFGAAPASQEMSQDQIQDAIDAYLKKLYAGNKPIPWWENVGGDASSGPGIGPGSNTGNNGPGDNGPGD